MAKQQPVALVFAGPVSRGTLGRLPGLRQRLTWVKSSSIPTASRAIHALGAGHAVAAYSDLRSAAAILISAPGPALRVIVEDLASSDLSWRNRAVVIYDSEFDSKALEPLRRAGAETASLIYHEKPEQFLAEGTPEALRFLRSLTGAKPLIAMKSTLDYRRAMRLIVDDFFPVMAAAIDALQKAGMTRAQAENTLGATVAESARTWLRAGKRLLKRNVKSPV
jgi:hypothetical protein